MGSHALSAKYLPIPEALRVKLVGEDYELSNFEIVVSRKFKDYRVALVTSHGPELPEFDIPLNYLRDRGTSVDIVTQDWLFDYQPEAPGIVVLIQWLAANVCVKADKKVSNAKIEDYDAVIIIGGAWNPIMLRTDETILKFISEAHNRGLLIAAICHGPQVLISSGVFPRGTLVTGVNDIRADLTNAGFRLLDDPNTPVVYDKKHRLITSPSPKALKEFCEQIEMRLQEVSPVAKKAA